MENVRKIIGKKWWMHPDLEIIDQEAWKKRGDRAGYFNLGHKDCNYNNPPVKEGVMDSQRPMVCIAPLTKAQYASQHAIQLQAGVPVSPIWMEYIIRHAVHDWRGIFEQLEDGPTVEVNPVHEDGPDGRRLTAESYRDLLFFYREEITVLVNIVMSI